MTMKSKFKDPILQSIRMERDQWDLIVKIAQLQTYTSKKYVSAHSLIRNALKMVFEDNEWLRECFRRTRKSQTSRWIPQAKKRK